MRSSSQNWKKMETSLEQRLGTRLLQVLKKRLTSLEGWEWKLTSVVAFWIDVRVVLLVYGGYLMWPKQGRFYTQVERTVCLGVPEDEITRQSRQTDPSLHHFSRGSLFTFPCYMMYTWCLLRQFLESNVRWWISFLVSSDTYMLPLNHRKVIDDLCQLRHTISPCLWRVGEAVLLPSKRPPLPMKLEEFLIGRDNLEKVVTV